MKKILLLTTAVLLSSTNVYSACNPNLPACQCAYPKMVNGIIGCSESYCGDKKCMPDGSCCPELNYCESTEKNKECCSEEQICDTTKGCVEKSVSTTCSSDADCASNLCNTSTGKCCPQIEGLPDPITLYENENAGMLVKSLYYTLEERRCELTISASTHLGLSEACDCSIDQECVRTKATNICEDYGGIYKGYRFPEPWGLGCVVSCYID